MRDRVRRDMAQCCVVRNCVASTMSRHLRPCLEACAQQCDSREYSQQRDPHRSTRNSLRACAYIWSSVAPLHHHHHKFLRWPRSRRASPAYPLPIGRGSSDSDARTPSATTTPTSSTQFFSLSKNLARTLHCGKQGDPIHDVSAACRECAPALSLPRNRSIAALSLGVLALAATALLWQPRPVAAQSEPAPSSVAFYTQRVQPIFESHCYRCHGGFNHRGHLSIATRAGLLRGGMDGAVVVPGNAAQSLLLHLIRHEGPADDPMPMPPPPHQKLSDADIATISQWIQAGMAMPPDQPKP
jgi:cytochrome c